MTEINKLIYNKYFKDISELSSLHFWLIHSSEPDLLNVDSQNYLNSFNADDFYNGELGDSDLYTNNINIELTNLYILEHNNNSYSVRTFNNDNANHFIPTLSTEIISKINTETITTDKINLVFIIYQYYDYLLTNPEQIFNFTGSEPNYYNITGSFIDDPNDPNTYDSFNNIKKLSDHKSALTNIKDKLNLELIFVCRGIYLTLYYRYIYNIYLSLYTECIRLSSSSCHPTPLSSINTLVLNLNHSIQKQILILNDHLNNYFRLETTYHLSDNTLKIQNPSAAVNTYFDTLNSDNHIIYDKLNNNFISITSDTDIKKFELTYTLPADISGEFTDGDTYYIITKNNKVAKSEYTENLIKLNNNNTLFENNKNNHKKSINNYKTIKSSFTNVDIAYYITIAIVIITLILIVASNSDKSFKTRVFILLLLVLLTYIIIFSYLEISKQFTEQFAGQQDIFGDQQIVANAKIQKLLVTIFNVASHYGKTDLYNILNKNINNNIKNIKYTNKNINLSANTNNSKANSEWHKLFQRTLFIHTTFLILIVVLVYLWLSIAIPELKIYLFILTILICMTLIFNYFRNLHRVVRTKYKHKYWTKMNL